MMHTIRVGVKAGNRKSSGCKQHDKRAHRRDVTKTHSASECYSDCSGRELSCSGVWEPCHPVQSL